MEGAGTQERVLALTYDDGPHPRTTPALLDLLGAAGAPATFFVLVEKAERHPEIVRRMLAEGHEVGFHGVDHARLSRTAPHVVRALTSDGVRRLRALGVEDLRWSRPTYGAQSPWGQLAVRSCGLRPVLWTGWARDWEDEPTQVLLERAVAAVEPGGVLLLHDDYEPDPRAPRPPPRSLDRPLLLQGLLADLSARGYRALTLSQLLAGCPARRRLTFAR